MLVFVLAVILFTETKAEFPLSDTTTDLSILPIEPDTVALDIAIVVLVGSVPTDVVVDIPERYNVLSLEISPIEFVVTLPDIGAVIIPTVFPTEPDVVLPIIPMVVLVGSVPTELVAVLPDKDMVTEEVVEPTFNWAEEPERDNDLELVNSPTKVEAEEPDILFVVAPYKGLILPVPVLPEIDNVLLVGSVPTELVAVLPDKDTETEGVDEPTSAEPKTISAGFTYPSST